MVGIEVVRRGNLKDAPATSGILRATSFDRDGLLFGRSTIPALAISDWHHHGDRSLYGVLVTGRLRIEPAPPTSDPPVELEPGDFFHVRVGVVHRDVNPDPTTPAIVVSALLGRGPSVINVAAP